MRNILLVLLYAASTVSIADGRLIDNDVLSQVFRVRIGEEFGTAFTIEVDSRQYLVTVDHLLPADCATCSLDVWRDSAWMRLTGTAIRPQSEEVGAVAIELTERLAPPSTARPTSEQLDLGAQVYFVGFPFGLRTAAASGASISEIPFVKTGILSAIDSRDPNAVVLYVDGHNNPGFSGGPMVVYPQGATEPRFAGVLIGYRWDPLPVVKREDLRKPSAETYKDLYAKGNSGIVVGFRIEHIVEAIRESSKNPHPEDPGSNR